MVMVLERRCFDLNRVFSVGAKNSTRHWQAVTRACGDTGWLHEKDWRDFREYEKEINVLLHAVSFCSSATVTMYRSRSEHSVFSHLYCQRCGGWLNGLC